MQIYNSLSRKIEDFKTIEKNKVKMYVCGPTPYDHNHIGHARTYIFFDFLRRYLEFRGMKVDLIMNLTDVDDKIIEQSKKFKSWQMVSDIYSREFFGMLKDLRIKPPMSFPRVTNHIQEIIELVHLLMDKGFAYQTNDGIYFDISKFPDYGKLSGRDLKDPSISRIESSPDKKNPADFAIWKFKKPGEPSWQAKFGEGRPGWHIECSAMSSKYLGNQFDIHGGGEDLVFPHHENEIAQSEAAFGKSPWVRYWIHPAFLMIDKTKMSKSLGNIVSAAKVIEKYEPELIRYFMLRAHYKKQLDFTLDRLDSSKEQWRKLVRAWYEVIQSLENQEFGKKSAVDEMQDAEKKLISALDNDLHSPNAFVQIEFVASLVLGGGLDKKSLDKAKKFFDSIDSVFAILPKPWWSEKDKQMAGVAAELRESYRKQKLFDKSDEIRAKMMESGVILEDTSSGQRIRFI
ncbi:MAG: cysteine--tRNA ligase [Candidatus Altiarchaeota archaeon]|nr:cysteine--tRNA ligase [Candidatus Altiarchaeota archaeon]